MTSTTAARKAYQQRYRAEHKKQTRRISVSVNKEELARLLERAVAYGERPTTHLKRCAFAQIAGVSHPTPAAAERLDTLVFLLRNMANNLNQMTRYSHEIRAVVEAGKALAMLSEIEKSARALGMLPKNEP
jgi:hypothetical protein